MTVKINNKIFSNKEIFAQVDSDDIVSNVSQEDSWKLEIEGMEVSSTLKEILYGAEPILIEIPENVPSHSTVSYVNDRIISYLHTNLPHLNTEEKFFLKCLLMC